MNDFDFSIYDLDDTSSYPNPSQDTKKNIPSATLEDFDFSIYDYGNETAPSPIQQKENNISIGQDIAEQVGSKGSSGFLGSIGNILDTFGLQLKEGQVLPGQKEINKIQSDLLAKRERGEPLSFGETLLLSDDDTLPSGYRLPTSKEIQSGIESVSGIGEGKTAEGRIAGRAAEFIGEGAATGGGLKTLAALGLSGVAGQGIREIDGPESLASAAEIGGSFVPSAIAKKLFPNAKSAKDIVDAGRKLGLTEKQITPLIQGEQKASILSHTARKGTKTKKLFASIKESLGDSYNNIKEKVKDHGDVNSKNRHILIDKFTSIEEDLQKTLAASPDKKEAIKFIKKAIKKVSNEGASPEELINFWQDINRSVNWNSIQGGKKSLAKLKEPILEVLKNVVPEVTKDFELTNELYSKYSQISKKLKPNLVDAFVNKGEVVAFVPSALAFATGNYLPLVSLGGEVAARLIGREMLINPYFQNISSKLVKNFNQGSVKGVEETVKQVKEFLNRKYPEEDFSFLTD